MVVGRGEVGKIQRYSELLTFHLARLGGYTIEEAPTAFSRNLSKERLRRRCDAFLRMLELDSNPSARWVHCSHPAGC